MKPLKLYSTGIVVMLVVLAAFSSAAFAPLGVADTRVLAQEDTSSQKTIDSCTEITEPGRYVLTENITDSTADRCIIISGAGGNDVILDGAGHHLDGVDKFPSIGISVGEFAAGGGENVTIQNLTITDWGDGISYTATGDGTIQNNHIASNSQVFHSPSGPARSLLTTTP